MKISASHFPLNGKYEVERKNASEGSSRNFVIGSEVFGIIGNRQGVTRERWALARHKRCKAIVKGNLGTFLTDDTDAEQHATRLRASLRISV